MKNFLNSLNKFYLCNFALVAVFILTVIANFAVQFRVENLEGRIAKNETEISSYKDQIKMLEVEWTYLTRPSRIRDLAQKYLTNSDYSLANQVRSDAEIQEFFLANHEAVSKGRSQFAGL